MLSPLIGTPHRYIHVGKSKRLPAISQQQCMQSILVIYNLVTPDGVWGLSGLRC